MSFIKEIIAKNNKNWFVDYILIITSIILLILTSYYSYLLFHSLVEIFTIAIAWGIFFIVWNTRHILDNNYLLFIGISIFFISLIDVFHTLAYKGMGVFIAYDANLPTQLWIAARYLQSISFLVAPLIMTKKIRLKPVIVSYILITLFLILSIFLNVFPACYVEGTGLTPFKIISEYIISLFFIISLVLLFYKRQNFNTEIFCLISGSIIFSVLSELAFTLYISVYGIANLIGHIFKFIAFYLIYRALIESSLTNPLDLLFGKLKQSEESYRLLSENAQDLIYRVRLFPEMKFEYVSPSSTRIVGYTPEEHYADPQLSLKIIHPDDRHILENMIGNIKIGKNPVQLRWICKDGSIIWTEQLNTPIYDNEGRLIAIEGIARDITERKRIEDQLKIEAELLNNATDAIYVNDLEGNYIYVNDTACKMHGYTREEFLKLNKRQVVIPKYIEIWSQRRQILLDKGDVIFDSAHFRKDGSIIPMETHAKLIEIGDKKYVYSVARDITEVRRIEEDLRLKAELLNNAADAIFVYDIDGKFVYVNDAACRTYEYSYDEFMNMNFLELLKNGDSSSFKEITQKVLAQGELIYEAVHIKKDGALMNVETHAKLFKSEDKVYILSASLDITERKKLEQGLIIADRMAVLGEMALGIGHELNNPLTSVIGFSQLLLENKNIEENVKDDLRKIHGEAVRAAEIIRSFITFARGKPTTKILININEVIDSVLKLRAYELKSKNINAVIQYGQELPLILADQSQIQHAFFNVIINSEYFMYEKNKGGILKVSTEKVDNFIRIVFEDNGPGISADVLPHVFEPFFTTKGVGKGAGLGLSVCYGIVLQHNGNIYVNSELGKWTKVTIELPTYENK